MPAGECRGRAGTVTCVPPACIKAATAVAPPAAGVLPIPDVETLGTESKGDRPS